MITFTALDAQNRMRADQPVILVVTRRRTPASDDAVRFVTAAARHHEVEAVALDADDSANKALLDELRVQFVPEVFVVQRGVVLERAFAHDANDARDLVAAALRRPRG